MSGIQQAVVKKRNLVWKILLFIFSLIALLLISLPYVIEKSAISWFTNQGVKHVEIRNIDVNLFEASFALEGLVLDDALKLGDLSVKLDVSALFKKTIVIQSFRLDNVTINLSQNPQQVWQLAGIPLSATSATPNTNSVKKNKSKDLWPVYINDVQLSQVLLTAKGQIKQNAIELILPLNSLQISGLKREQNGAQQLKTRLKLGELTFKGFAYQINQQNLQLDSKISLPAMGHDFATGTKIQDINLVAKRLAIKAIAKNLTLSIIDKLTLKNASLISANKVSFEQLLLQSVTLPKVGKETLGKIAKVIISHADLDLSGAYHLDKLLLADLQLKLIKQKEGKLSVINHFQQQAIALESEANKPSKTAVVNKAKRSSANTDRVAQANSNIYIKTFTISKGSRIFIQDKTFTPVLSNTLYVEKFNFSPIDLSGAKKAKLDVLFKLDKNASLKINGDTSMNTEVLEADIKVLLKNFDMLVLSSFVESDYGHSIVAGQVDLDTQFKLNKDQIDANNKLILRKLSLEKAQHISKPNKKLPMPLDTALDMLRDDRGDITMNVPVTGNINDPNINIDDVINKALSSAISSSVTTYAKLALQPYGAIFMLGEFAMGLAKEAAKPRLTAITFDLDSNKLSADMKNYTGKIAELMQSKSFRLQLCGVATLEEKTTLVKEKPKTKTDEQLLALAQARADKVLKAIESKGVNADRLFYCKAKIDTTSTEISSETNKTVQVLPRVELIID